MQKTSIDAQSTNYNLWKQPSWSQAKSEYLEKQQFALPMSDNIENDSSDDSFKRVIKIELFSSEEDNRLRKFVTMYGDVNWTRISKLMLKSAK